VSTPLRPSLRARLGARLPEKVAVLLGLALGICIPYFSLQRVEFFPLRSLPAVWLDGWVAFDPAWIWPYASIALLVPLGPLLATRRDQLARYARGLALLCVSCFAFFLLFPVEGPRPEVAPDHAVYRLMVAYDRPANSLPSLHAGLVVYTFLFGYRVLRDALAPRERAAFVATALVWTGLILYATLATKQHWALDIPPGVLFAWAAHRLAWRGSGEPATAAATG
jgi:hypothetical protein